MALRKQPCYQRAYTLSQQQQHQALDYAGELQQFFFIPGMSLLLAQLRKCQTNSAYFAITVAPREYPLESAFTNA